MVPPIGSPLPFRGSAIPIDRDLLCGNTFRRHKALVARKKNTKIVAIRCVVLQAYKQTTANHLTENSLAGSGVMPLFLCSIACLASGFLQPLLLNQHNVND